MSRSLSFVLALFVSIFALALSTSQVYALSYGSGTYTNLCGTGYSATANTCNKGCNTGSGTCSASGSFVVKYTCSGRQTECRSNESGFSTSQSLSGVACGQTVQIDVFNKQCRVNGQWLCDGDDLQDYMVWYSGDCAQPTRIPTRRPTATPTRRPTATPTRRPTNTPTGTLAPTSTPLPTATLVPQSTCDALDVIEGNNTLVPANVLLRARGSDDQGAIQRYRFYFGDGSQADSTNPEIRHTYESSGTFVARVDVQDSRGVWKSSPACEQRVTVKAASIETHRSGCSDIHFLEGNNTKAPTTGRFQVTGFDNKGSIKRYKLDFGNGITKESDSGSFEQVYDTPGTYTLRAYVLDSKDQWVGNENNCRRSFYVNTEALKSQPKTGTPTLISLIGVSAGVVGFALLKFRDSAFAPLTAVVKPAARHKARGAHKSASHRKRAKARK